jgi:hypothetical protein
LVWCWCSVCLFGLGLGHECILNCNSGRLFVPIIVSILKLKVVSKSYFLVALIIYFKSIFITFISVQNFGHIKF